MFSCDSVICQRDYAGRGPASFLRESGRLFPVKLGNGRLRIADGPPQAGGAASH